MGIEWFRDLAIIILGLGVTVSAVLIAIMAWMLYRKLRPILDSVQTTTKTLENFSVTVGEGVCRPLGQVVGFIQGVRNAVKFAGRFRKH